MILKVFGKDIVRLAHEILHFILELLLFWCYNYRIQMKKVDINRLINQSIKLSFCHLINLGLSNYNIKRFPVVPSLSQNGGSE
jgi:hypothetical protein